MTTLIGLANANGQVDRVLELFPVLNDTLLKIKAEGNIRILLVEQYLDFALSLADVFCIMDCGSIVASGPIKDLNDDLIRAHLIV